MEILCALQDIWKEIYDESESKPETGLIIDEPVRFEYLM